MSSLWMQFCLRDARQVSIYSNRARDDPGGYSLYLDDRDEPSYFLGVEIGDLVFFRGCSSKIL